MRKLTQDNITDVFLSYCGKDTDPRMREIMASLAKHLHAFAKEVRLTHAEWQTGIDFMERMTEFTDAERHEFVLLSDVLGLSSLVDMINSVPEGTSSSVLGPFHISGAPDIPLGHDMKRHYEGPILLARGRITDQDGSPIEGARLDIWQTAPNGLYSSQDPEQDTYSFHGVQTTGADGCYGLPPSSRSATPCPAMVPWATSSMRSADIPGGLSTCTTSSPPRATASWSRRYFPRTTPISTKTPSSACAKTWS